MTSNSAKLTVDEFTAYRQALDDHVIVEITDRLGKITFANNKFCEISGYVAEEIIGQDHNLLNSGYHSTKFFKRLWDTVTEGKTWRGEIRNKRKDGTYFWVDTTITPIVSETGAIEKFITVRTEITKTKKALTLLQSTIDYFPGGISIYNGDNQLVLANDHWYEMLDIPKRLFPLGSRYEDLIRFNRGSANSDELGDPEETVKERLEVVSKHEPYTLEHICANGNIVEINGFPLPQGGFVNTYLDVTDRTKAAQNLEKSQELFNMVISDSGIGIWDWYPEQDRLFLHESFQVVIGAGYSDVYEFGDYLLELIHPDYCQVFLDAVKRDLLKGDGKLDITVRIMRSDGELAWATITGRAFRNTEGRVIRALGKIVDTTKLKESELELLEYHKNLENRIAERTREVKQSHNRLQSAINALSQGFVLLSPEGEVVISNSRMREFFPEAAESLRKGANIRQFIRSQKPDLSDEELENICANFLATDYTAERTLKDGRVLRISRIESDNGDKIVIDEDITVFREQEKLLRRQTEELGQALEKEKELNELQRQFVAMASHEFRTPLAIIDSAAQRMNRRSKKLTPEEVLKRVEKIRGAVKRMANLMDSTLAAARIDSGKIDVSIEPSNIRAVILEVVRRQGEISSSHVISADLDRLPETIRASESALDQVFTNLMSNAVKYSPDNPEINISGWQDHDDVVISIEDKGLGIDDEDMPHMFGRYFRAATSTGIAGTGIGLNLVKMLVEAHGGSVGVESTKGVGSIFTVRLPIAGPAEPIEEDFSTAVSA